MKTLGFFQNNEMKVAARKPETLAAVMKRMKKSKTREDQAVDMEEDGPYFGRPGEVGIVVVAVQAPGITMGVHD